MKAFQKNLQKALTARAVLLAEKHQYYFSVF
jgi:hypothetical protein